ncbi:hypothetical protein F0562_003991 [Nyssa sinensis]|uniref:KIB1-4 beta-propeller domain-containing protein n=1 Tax=Nyssa sinensis TaxID=561372 RepID=A0A5J5C0X2_9ASTE|nr:hypothetical protein F0562_003991 [Nyssa sinensis]
MADLDTVQWSQLPKDILTMMIAKGLNTRLDNLRLRSVCSSWRSSVPPFKKTPPLPLTLPFPIAPNPALNRKRRGHFSLTESTIYLVEPPRKNPKSNTSKSKTSSGWLLRVEEAENGKMHPLNPLSKIMTEHVLKTFPKSLNLLNFRITEIGKAYSLKFVDLSKKIETSFGELKSILVKKVVISSNPWTSDADNYAVMAIHGGKLGFIKVGGKKWSAIDDPKQSHYDDVVYHKGHFYAVDHRGRVVVIDSDLKTKEIARPTPGFGCGQFKYLVKACGDLFLIDKYMDAEQDVSDDEFIDDYIFEEVNPDVPVHLKAFKLNEEEGKWEWVETLGDWVFFVGDDCSYSVSARGFSGLKGDRIYFSDDTFTRENEQDRYLGEFCVDTSIYILEDPSCGPLASFPDHSQIFWSCPAWLKTKPRASKK